MGSLLRLKALKSHHEPCLLGMVGTVPSKMQSLFSRHLKGVGGSDLGTGPSPPWFLSSLPSPASPQLLPSPYSLPLTCPLTPPFSALSPFPRLFSPPALGLSSPGGGLQSPFHRTPIGSIAVVLLESGPSEPVLQLQLEKHTPGCSPP